ncbi:transcription/translation regulatory transformer protein RfaH [Stutzerimonas azotifigens]|uniref:transcription/translation regulatory transformer protein RfaH n=1 Tax=Stutzerimonas azotifigens TaxID=291995 RepID=UPI000423604D|nr:transcription/translation regulatory transformer protein RfaH [Stutzerimonas azotifigens]
MSSGKEKQAHAWYLVQCKPRQDERAEEHLRRQGYFCYRPKYKQEVVLRGKRQIISGSLFPGYVFIQLSQTENWAPLRSTRGVSRIVSFGGQPTPISADLIEKLRQHEQTYTAEAPLNAGEKVRIKGGAFAEVEAIFLAMDGQERVVLLLNILQREHQIRMPLRGITKI